MRFGLGFAVEGDEDQAEGVDRGQEGTGQACVEQPLVAAGEGFPEDLVLGIEAGGDQGQGRQGRAADALAVPGVPIDSADLDAAGLPITASEALLRRAALAPLTDVAAAESMLARLGWRTS